MVRKVVGSVEDEGPAAIQRNSLQLWRHGGALGYAEGRRLRRRTWRHLTAAAQKAWAGREARQAGRLTPEKNALTNFPVARRHHETSIADCHSLPDFWRVGIAAGCFHSADAGLRRGRAKRLGKRLRRWSEKLRLDSVGGSLSRRSRIPTNNLSRQSVEERLPIEPVAIETLACGSARDHCPSIKRLREIDPSIGQNAAVPLILFGPRDRGTRGPEFEYDAAIGGDCKAFDIGVANDQWCEGAAGAAFP